MLMINGQLSFTSQVVCRAHEDSTVAAADKNASCSATHLKRGPVTASAWRRVQAVLQMHAPNTVHR